jgi:phage host-nuclease inhibitor protein Gam
MTSAHDKKYTDSFGFPASLAELETIALIKKMTKMQRRIEELEAQIAELTKEPEEPDRSKYVTIREMNCMRCRKPGRCEVTFHYTDAGKVKAANVTRMEDGWRYKPYGKAGGKAPYCRDCAELLERERRSLTHRHH